MTISIASSFSLVNYNILVFAQQSSRSTSHIPSSFSTPAAKPTQAAPIETQHKGTLR
ncbi:MAG TPA: hypothetical protein VH415_01885 [Nitrososphaeraceae archaeon]